MKYMWFIAIVSMTILGSSYGDVVLPEVCVEGQPSPFVINISDTTTAGTILANSSKSVQIKDTINCRIFNISDHDELILKVDATRICEPQSDCALRCGDANDVTIILVVAKLLEYNISFSNSTYYGSVVEMAVNKTPVKLNQDLMLESMCLDGVSNPQFTFVGNERIPFSWEAVTHHNNLKVNGLIDYEKNQSFTFLMEGIVVINKNIPSTATTTIHITVIDIDDNRPAFNISVTEHYQLSIEENKPFTSPLPTEPPIFAFDPDRGLNETILYNLITTDNGPFSIGERDGKISYTGKLDYETKSKYTVIVKAAQKDQQLTRTAVATLIIHVIDVDDHVPMFNDKSYNCNIIEHSIEHSYICTVTAIDEDTSPEYKKFTYFIWEDIDVITIDNATGVITVSNSSKLDRDSNIGGDPLIVHVGTKTSNGSYGGNTTVSIDILDINDNNPVFTETTYNFDILDVNNGIIGVVNATDLDANINGEVEYEAMMPPSGSDCSTPPTAGVNPFDVNKTTGEISMSNEDIFCQHYQLVVQACDKGINRRCSTATVLITNSKAESLKNLTDTLKIFEEAPKDTYVGFVKCCSGGRQCEYHGPPEFYIDNTTGMLVTKKVLDREVIKAPYDVLAKVFSNGKLLCNVNIIVTVLDVNDNAPRFDQEFYSFTIPDPQEDVLVIGSIKAIDDDIEDNANISYSLQNSGFVQINLTNGNMSINASNVDRIDIVRVYAVAMDHGTPALQTSVPVYIIGPSEQPNSIPISTIMNKTAIEESSAKLAGEISEVLNMEVLIQSVTTVNNSKYAIRSKVHISPKSGKKSDQEFLSAVVTQYEVIKNIFTQPSAQSADRADNNDGGLAAPEIGLIAMACVILIGTIIAVVVIQRQFSSQKRYRQLYETMTKNSSLYESQEIKMDVEDETSSVQGSIKEKDLESNTSPPSPNLITSSHNPNFTDDVTNVKLVESSEPKEQSAVSNALQELSDSYEKDDNEELNQDDGSTPVVYANTLTPVDSTEVVFIAEVEPEIIADSECELRQKDSDLINFDNEGISDKDGNDEDTPAGDDLEEEPNPDYDIKQVRFSTEVLDADENKIEPLRVKTEDIENEGDNSDEAVVADNGDETVNDENDVDMNDGSAGNVSQTSGYSSDNNSSGENDFEKTENEDRLEEEIDAPGKDFYFESIESTHF